MIGYGPQWIRANAVGGSRSEVIFWLVRGVSHERRLGYPIPSGFLLFIYIQSTRQYKGLFGVSHYTIII